MRRTREEQTKRDEAALFAAMKADTGPKPRERQVSASLAALSSGGRVMNRFKEAGLGAQQEAAEHAATPLG